MKSIQQIALIWFVWSILIIVYMQFSATYINSTRTDGQQEANYYPTQPYLNEPFLNSQVSWDSEFYLSVATVGYDDENVRLVSNQAGTESYSMSYAFFPFYPYLMKLVRLPFVFLGLKPIVASTLAGLLISLLGTLGAMLALYDLGRDELGEELSVRATFLMLMFPTSYYFAVIYTEGLFVGLAFGSLAMLHRKHWLAAAFLAALATWTRSIGLALFLPSLLYWGLEYYKSEDKHRLLLRFPLLFAPVVAYLLWRFFFGEQFDFVQIHYFGNNLFDIQKTISAWQFALSPSQYYPAGYFQRILGLGAVIFALLTCLLNWRKFSALSLFGAIALLVPMTSGAAGTFSALRFVLVVPTLWFSLTQWSQSKVFGIVWMLISGVLLALYAFLFSVEIWSA
jgi:hypothetical protein